MLSATYAHPPADYAYMDIRFYLRRAKAPGAAGTVYCSLTSGGVQATPFSTGIQAWPPASPGARPTKSRQWQNAPVQRLFGEAPDVRADNAVLAALYAKIRQLHTLLLDSGQPAGPLELATALRRTGQAIPTLAGAADLFLAAAIKKVRPADAPAWEKGGYSAATIRKYKSRLGLLTEYLLKIRQPHLALTQFTAKHADALVQGLVQREGAPGRLAGRARGKSGAEYARKVVGLISQVLDYAVNQEWIAANPLGSWSGPRGSEKPLVYLLPEQVTQLEQYAFTSEYLQRCADSFLFSCWTGLAWSDLNQFNATQHISDGWLAMLRTKTGTSFTLPLLPGAQRLLTKYGATGLPRYENQPLNRALKEIALLLGWQQDITTHAGRRTFGMFLLNEDVPLATVAAILGHKDERTTSRHYARFIERRKVERDMKALQARLAA